MSELFLKDKKVLTLKDIEGVPREIRCVDAPELLPVYLQRECTIEKLNKWLSLREIPESREGFAEAKERFGTAWLENKNYACLTDHYWIKKRTETWKKINFFTNVYSKDIGNMFFTPWSMDYKRINNFSPDLTTNGILRKRWIQEPDKSSILIKAGSIDGKQEPLSEVLVSALIEKTGIVQSAGYDLHVEGMVMCVRSKNFITLDTELVPASHFYYNEPRKEGESVYSHLIEMCDKMEIPNAKEFIDGMIFIDNLSGNEDRNLGNIGFLRDVNTMKFIGPAPLYDCGNAYWSTKKINEAVKSKLFGDVENKIFKQIKKEIDCESIFKSRDYEKIIESYPGITDEKKGNLISEIKKRNNRLLKDKQLENVL